MLKESKKETRDFTCTDLDRHRARRAPSKRKKKSCAFPCTSCWISLWVVRIKACIFVFFVYLHAPPSPTSAFATCFASPDGLVASCRQYSTPLSTWGVCGGYWAGCPQTELITHPLTDRFIALLLVFYHSCCNRSRISLFFVFPSASPAALISRERCDLALCLQPSSLILCLFLHLGLN